MNFVIEIYSPPYTNYLYNHDFNCSIVTKKGIYAYEDRKLIGYKYNDGAPFSFRSVVLSEIIFNKKN